MSGVASEIVSVSITADSVGVQQAGFGIPLLLSNSGPAWVERVRTYESSAGVLADFSATAPEYLAAVAMFSQSVKPEQIKIGRRALKPTQKYSITPAVANSTDYKVRVGATTYTYTSDANATNDEIVDGLAALINAGSGDTTTATTPGGAGFHVLTLTADAAGNFDAVEVLNPDLLALTQDHVDPGLATDLAAIALEDNTWYFLTGYGLSKAEITALATYAEANEKLCVVATPDTNNITLASGGDTSTSVMASLKNSAFARTAAIYHPAEDDFTASAWLGRVAPTDPGSETWKFKTLAGVAAVTLTATHKTNINAKNGNHYRSVSGVNMTAEGKVAEGEFIDVIRFRDWLKARMSETVFSHLAAADKIPFTDAGIAVVEADVRAILREGVAVGGLADDPAPTVTVPKASAVSTADKTARTLPDVKFTATLAGAIHFVEITGVVSV